MGSSVAKGPKSEHTVRFGLFEFKPRTLELTWKGVERPLQDQPARLLALLLDRPGELITREELQREIWPADTFVEFDLNLNTAVRKVRRALDDSASSPRFIETLPRQGYRFIA